MEEKKGGSIQNKAFKPERVEISRAPRIDCPETATDTDGIIVPCVFEEGHQSAHRFIRFMGVENRCGFCGETFEISETDPHWSSGRGPICPTRAEE